MSGRPTPRRVVFDTNTIVSAVIAGDRAPPGSIRAAVDAALAGASTVVVCPSLLDELEQVLGRPKLRRWVEPDAASAVLTWLLTAAILVADPDDIPPVCRDPDDDLLVALALAHDAALITGEADLQVLPSSIGLLVMTAREYVESLGG